MSVEREFTEENFMRATRHTTMAKVLAHVVAAELPRVCPNLWSTPPRITALASQGWSNLTLRVEREDHSESFILRLSERRGINETHPSRSRPQFEKERHVLGLLCSHEWAPKLIGPVSGVLALDTPGHGHSTYAFMLQSFIPFESARDLQAGESRERVLERLAGLARLIHSTPLPDSAWISMRVHSRSPTPLSPILSSRISTDLKPVRSMPQ